MSMHAILLVGLPDKRDWRVFAHGHSVAVIPRYSPTEQGSVKPRKKWKSETPKLKIFV